MANPFTIRIFVPQGDPEGIRIIDRLSSTGIFFAFPRDKWGDIKNRSELTGAGIYILSGYSQPNDEIPTIYVGQADTICNRIENHTKNKDFWDKAVIFVSANKLNSTHAKWLEYALIKRLHEANRSNVNNSTNPLEPTISEAEKAEMFVFLTEIYQTLPLVGMRAFEIPQPISKPLETNSKALLDTIVVPAKEDGFNEVFLGQNAWYAIRIAGGMLKKVKYIASYRTSPVSAITHYAEIERIEPYGEDGKYKLIFSQNAKQLEHPLTNNVGAGTMQSPRYTNLAALLSAKQMSDIFS